MQGKTVAVVGADQLKNTFELLEIQRQANIQVGNDARVALIATTQATNAAVTVAQTAVSRAIDGLTAANANPADPDLVASRVRVGALAQTARGTAGVQVGWNIPYWLHRTDAREANPALRRDAMLTLLLASGARAVRTDMRWDIFEPTEGQYDWSDLDWLFGVADLYSLHVIGVVKMPAPWAADHNQPPKDASKLARICGLIAQRASGYKNMRLTLEVWNEPNATDTPWPANTFGPAVVACWDAARAYGVQVITGATDRPDASYYAAMYAAAPRLSEITGIGTHLYPRQQRGPDYRATGTELEAYNRLSDMRAVMDAQGHTNGTIWVTETGWTTGGTSGQTESIITPDQLALYAEKAVREVRDNPRLGVACLLWFALGQESAAGHTEDYFGSHTSTGQPKPHWRVLRQMSLSGTQAATAPLPLPTIEGIFARAKVYLPNDGAGAFYPDSVRLDSQGATYVQRQGRRVLRRPGTTAQHYELQHTAPLPSDMAIAGWVYPRFGSADNSDWTSLISWQDGGGGNYRLAHTHGAIIAVRESNNANAQIAPLNGVVFSAGDPLFFAVSVSNGLGTAWVWTPQSGAVRANLGQFFYYTGEAGGKQISRMQYPGGQNYDQGPVAIWDSLNDAEVEALRRAWWPTLPAQSVSLNAENTWTQPQTAEIWRTGGGKGGLRSSLIQIAAGEVKDLTYGANLLLMIRSDWEGESALLWLDEANGSAKIAGTNGIVYGPTQAGLTSINYQNGKLQLSNNTSGTQQYTFTAVGNRGGV